MIAALLVTSLAASTALSQCWVPREQFAGWKRVDLPSHAPALAAPEDIPQFRSGEPVWLEERDPRGYLGATRQRGGKTEYAFQVPKGTRRLTVDFVASLRGAGVDGWAYGAGRTWPLLDDQRHRGTSVELRWDLPDVDGVVVRVHHHLRPVPVVAQWRSARWVDVTAEPGISPAFQVPRSLYFLHPGGRTVALCSSEGQQLRVDRAGLEGQVSDATLEGHR